MMKQSEGPGPLEPGLSLRSNTGDGTLAPTSPTDADQPDTRLSTLIDEARARGTGATTSERRDRALADREFSHIPTRSSVVSGPWIRARRTLRSSNGCATR